MLEKPTTQKILITFPILVPDTTFSRSFFPSTLIEWNNFDINIRISGSYANFKETILRFIRSSENLIFNCHNPSGIKLTNRLRLGFNHLHQHKFRHNFQNSLNLICSRGENIETIPLTTFFIVLTIQMKE